MGRQQYLIKFLSFFINHIIVDTWTKLGLYENILASLHLESLLT